MKNMKSNRPFRPTSPVSEDLHQLTALKAVDRTSHISFNPEDKTFRIYTSNSIYAFCINSELNLEHLHWGESLPPEYDLRYLSQSSRATHFNTVSASPDRFGGKIILEAETLDEIQSTWRENKVWAPKDMDDSERFNKRRLENYAWRIMSKVKMSDANTWKSYLPSSRGKHDPMRRIASVTDLHSSASGGHVATETNSLSMKSVPSDSDLCESKEHLTDTAPSALGNFGEPTLKGLRHPVIDKLPGRQPQRRSINKEKVTNMMEKVGKGGLCSEYSDHGTGDFRTPSFMVVDNFNGSGISPLRYRCHKIYKGKLPMPDSMPGVRCANKDEASTLVVTLADSICGLEVDLVYVTMHDYNVIIRRTVFRNNDRRTTCSTVMMSSDGTEFECGSSSKVILKASSTTVDFEAEPQEFHCVQLSGSWARERYVHDTRLQAGNHSFGSVQGVSSHQHNPFGAITFGTPHESHGEVRAFSLVYSGNFLFEAQLAETGRLRVHMGIHPMGLQWCVRSGEQFATPEVIMTRSMEGLSGMSRIIHRLFLDRLIPKNWSDENPPIVINTWEAKYFHVNYDNVVELARKGVQAGGNLLVLDDGWFGNRDNIDSSMGDWVVNNLKFPMGLKKLAEDINAIGGCKFGIWMEPEMISEDSLLYKRHPDWYLHVPGRPPQLGRNQMVLDLSRKDVRNYIYEAVACVLSSANIEYLKWDMNRPLTEVYSAATGETDAWQSEISHRYVLGLYELQRRITEAFPHVLLENCASGGGRFDPGMLYYSSQIWCSDNTDALVRMRIQYGTSIVYPARVIGSHISTVPNHITGNSSRLRTRGFIAMCGTFGFELDFNQCTQKDMNDFRKLCDTYLTLAKTIRFGDVYRLWNPFRVPFAAWMYVSCDKSEAVVFAFSMNSDHWSNLVPRLTLAGLECETDYEVTEPMPNNLTQSTGNVMIIETEVAAYQLGMEKIVLSGKVLMTAGLPVKFFTLDDSVLFVLKRVKR